MRILFLAAEAAPLAQVGGLGEVAGALPRALAALGHEVRVVLPFSGVIDRERFKPRLVAQVAVPHVGGEQVARVSEVLVHGVRHNLIAGPPIPKARRVYGKDIAEDGPKFIFFSLAALGLCRALDWAPDVLHANDAHAGPAVYWLATARPHDEFFKHTASVFTIHNLVYMNNGAGPYLKAYGLAPSDSPLLPDWARDSLLGLGLAHADVLNTVSPTHAEELLTPEFGHGLEGVLRARRERLSGILNGLDLSAWDPARDKALPRRYGPETLERRAANKRALQRELGLPVEPETPLAAMVSRLDTQKGVELALDAMRALMVQRPNPLAPFPEMEGGKLTAVEPVQFAMLGKGLPELEKAARGLAREFPQRVAAVLRFDRELAHRMYGGADLVLVPSRYEPCGLTQMIALRYGAVPVVRRTGGLADTVTDADAARTGNGFSFTDYNPAALGEALRRALARYRQPTRWQALQKRGLRQAAGLGWDRSARAYQALYQHALALRETA